MKRTPKTATSPRVVGFMPRAIACVVALLVPIVVTEGCGSSDSNGLTGQATASADTCSGSLESLRKNVFGVSCAAADCHSSDSRAAGLDLSATDLERELVGVSSGTCDGWVRVTPGSPERSLLWLKLYSESPPCGAPMPLGSHLNAVELGCVREWIRHLPKGTSSDAGTPVVDSSAPPESANNTCQMCPAGSTCSDGKCVCADSLALCGGSCVDLLANAENCGKCGAKCTSGALCNVGECVCQNGEVCGTACVDKASDPKNCGACDHACSSGQVCLAGVCAAGCGSLTNCGGACVDTQTSVTACGACGTVCPSGASCVGGRCACPSGTADCGGKCVDVVSDPNNCGACGKICGSGQVCSAGQCACSSGGTACGTKCVDLKTDPSSCGACGKSCSAGQSCISGACECSGGTVSFSNAVQPIFTSSCALRGCHGSTSPKEGLNLASGAAYSNLVGVPAQECSGKLRVAPGSPGTSYLINKLTGVGLCSGSQMPKAGSSLPKSEIDAIAGWICNGAPKN